eukprot:g1566.t1
MEDSPSDVKKKIKGAFCEEKVVKGNPCLSYLKHIVFPSLDSFDITRKPENGGDKSYKTYEELESDFASGDLHPGDLKPALAAAINKILDPVRKHFTTDKRAKDLLKRVKEFKVTR